DQARGGVRGGGRAPTARGAAGAPAAAGGGDGGGGQGGGASRGPALDRGRAHPANPAETVAVSGADGAAGRTAADAASLHPAGAGAHGQSAAPHAGNRRIATSGAGRTAGQARRGGRRSSGKAQGEPAATTCCRRPRSPRRSRGAGEDGAE